MVIRNRATFVPVFLWTLLCIGMFLLALVQEKTGLNAIPHLTLANSFGWISSLLLLYFVLVWPLTLESLMERFARKPQAEGTYSVFALQEPLLIVLYMLPLLVLSAMFGFKGHSEIFQTLLVLAVTGFVTWAHFRLGFFFHGSMAKSYFLVAGALCVLIPAANLVFNVFLADAPFWLNNLNPFYALFAVSGSGVGVRTPVVIYSLVFGGLTAAFVGVPFFMALPPRVYKDIAG